MRRSVRGWTAVIAVTILAAATAGAQDAASYYPVAKGNKWSYDSTSKTTVSLGGMEIPIVDTRGTTTIEIVGPSEQVPEPKGVVVERSLVSEKGLLNMAESMLEYTATRHLGWSDGALALHQVQSQGIPGREPSTEKYTPPLVALKGTKQGDAWPVGTMREQKLSLPAKARIAAVEDVTVPAGKFEKCLKVVTEITEPAGQIEGGGLTLDVKKGTLTTTAWYAPGVGMVREEAEGTLTLEAQGMEVELAQKRTMALQPGYMVQK